VSRGSLGGPGGRRTAAARLHEGRRVEGRPARVGIAGLRDGEASGPSRRL